MRRNAADGRRDTALRPGRPTVPHAAPGGVIAGSKRDADEGPARAGDRRRTAGDRARSIASAIGTAVSARLANLRARPFWGRATLLDRVEAALGTPGGNVLLVGHGGVGKTALAFAALRRATERDPALRVLHVTATESTRGTPLAVFEPLLPDRVDPHDQVSRIGQAVLRAGLAADVPSYGAAAAKPAQLVLHVDDAPLLDPVSDEVVDYLVSRTDVRVVLTSRVQPGPSALVVRSVRDGLLERVEVPELSSAEIAEFAAAALPGRRLAPDALQRIEQTTGGNTLFVAELLRTLDTSNALEERHGLWHWTAPLPSDTSLADLLRVEIEQLPPDARTAFEYLALSAPVSLDLVAERAPLDAVARLEAEGLVSVRTSARAAGPVVDLTHPLYGEAMTSLLSPSEAVARYRDLFATALPRVAAGLDGPDGTWSGETSELLALVGWGVEGAADVPLPLLVAAFEYGRPLADHDFRIRIASALLRRSDLDPALRSDVLANRAEAHRFVAAHDLAADDLERAIAVADGLDDEPGRADRAIRLARVAVEVLLMAQGDWRGTLRVVEWADGQAAHLTGAEAETARVRLDVLRAVCLSFGGEMHDALALADDLQARTRGGPEFLPIASTVVLALGQRGLARRSRALARQQLRAALANMRDRPYVVGEMFGVWIVSDLQTGAMREASLLLSLVYAAADRNPGNVRLRQSNAALGRGLLAAANAEWSAAVDHLSLAAGELDDFSDTGSGGMLLGTYALALAAEGRLRDSARVAERFHALESVHTRTLDLPVRYALLLAGMYEPAGGDAEAARELLDDARRLGFELVELRALHALTVIAGGLERSDRARVRELGEALDAPVAAPLAASVEHVLEGGTPSLGDAARTLARRGLIVPTPAHPTLTQREQQVAELFALGYTNAQVAKKLHISKRTIETHTAKIFQKLDVASRDDIADGLERR